ncbi:MAG: hypothetical protein BIFFINMI_01541 [Phycisphaerae bacterium]|nr:hypothetical protein [Phycisphaerae bacterium]
MSEKPQAPRWPTELDRYSRQMLFEPVGVEGQRRLASARALLVGVGALGTVQANALVRAGLGHLTVVDRDFIEPNNLQRQTLFDEQDIAEGLPKAEAARRKLACINSAVTVDAVIADVNHRNIKALARDADILLDGTDNFETRYLINDLAVKTGRPWIYGAAVGATGLEMAILPHKTPCIRCLFEDRPPPEANPTCDTAGVLGPVVGMVADLQSLDAIKILTGHADALAGKLTHIDAWAGRIVQLDVGGPRADCPCCGRGNYEFLGGRLGGGAVTLCGRNAVQVAAPAAGVRLDFAAVAARVRSVADATFNNFMLKFTIDGHAVTVFADGRAIIAGTHDPAVARGLYSRYVGS